MSSVKIRGGHRAMAVRLINTIDCELQSDICDMDELEVNVEELKNQQHSILLLDHAILQDIEDEAKIDCEMIDSSERKLDIDRCILRVKKFRTAHSSGNLTHEKPSREFAVKLPQIHLPTFDGDSTEWLSFWDSFEGAIHQRVDLSGAHKFNYLKGQLRGEALKLLEGFLLTNSNYIEAVSLLKDTYGRPNKIILTLLFKLFDLRSPNATVSDLCNFRSKYECCLRGIRTLRADVDSAGFVLAALLMRKLPIKIQDNLNRHAPSTELWELESFRIALNTEIDFIQALDNKSKNNAISNNTESSSSLTLEPEIKSATAGSFNVSTETSGSSHKFGSRYDNRTRWCGFCDGSHISSCCEDYFDRSTRLERAKQLGLCLNCLKKHPTDSCKSKFSCYACGKKHHTSLCPGKVSAETKKSREDSATIAWQSQATAKKSIALPTAILPIIGYRSVFEARALFDQCAQRTLLLSSVMRRLKLKVIEKIELSINGVNKKGKRKIYDVVEVKIQVGTGIVYLKAVVVDDLPRKISVPGIKHISHELNLKGVRLADYYQESGNICEISLLIGADYYYNFVSGIKNINGVHLISTCFGEMISGELPFRDDVIYNSSTDIVTILQLTECTDDSLQNDLERLWSFDSFGINDDKDLMKDKVLTKFKDTIQFQDGKYITRLPWKDNHSKLPTNYTAAYGMLRSTLRRLYSDPIALRNYNDIFKNQLKRQFIELVEENTYDRIGEVHYLPHHGIEKSSITTPLRIVFNCSSGKPSLNDCLFSGPSLVEDLTHILLRFRLHSFVATSDIEKAFLMISLHPDDRNYTRFLWPEDPGNPFSKILIYRFKVVLFGATCSQFLLNASILYHLEKFDGEEISYLIRRGLYVDNLFCGFEDEMDLLKFYSRSKEILSEANLNLRGWTTNSPLLMQEVNQNMDSCSDGEKKQKVLGMMWNTVTDVITLPRVQLDSSQETTKRLILSQASKIFDPLGYFSPIHIRSKILLQELWKKKISWDESLDVTDQRKWLKIKLDLEGLSQIEIPRRVTCDREVSLHAFSDASASAYGVVIYLVDSVESNILFAKARVAPIKKLTIPKLELVAATNMVKLVINIMKAFNWELNFGSIHLWSDSQIVLSWLTSCKKLKPFIERRVRMVQEMLPKTAFWHYVPSNENPADLASRGVSLQELTTSDLWFHGPKWLTDVKQWPKLEFNIVSVAAFQDMVTLQKSSEVSISDELIDYDRFSSFNKLLRTVALVVRFGEKARGRKVGKSSIDFSSHNISIEEMTKSELLLVRDVQRSSFVNEFDAMLKNKGCRKTGLMKQLNLKLKDQILRCEGRIGYSDLDFDSKHPILMPSKHRVSRLIIEDCHRRSYHSGVNDTVATLRQRWWMPKIRQNVKTVLRTCIVCKRYQGRPYKLPDIGHLPPERTRETRPFEVVGVDFTGALMVRSGKQTVKYYIALFTCAVSRAVHLELVENLTADSFLNSFRRFIGRRSCPKYVYSDNATNFTAASKTIDELLRHPTVETYSSAIRCQWRFIPRKAPWFGGFWERLIGLTKNCIKKTLGRSLVSFEQLQTLVIEVEAKLNSRPLTYASGSMEDDTPITPSHLLCGKRLDALPVTNFRDFDENFDNRSTISSAHRRLLKIIVDFWSRWRKEYLVSLREHHWSPRGSIAIQDGDVVLIDDGNSRISWRLGRVIGLIEGRDGKVRSAHIRTNTGITLRPIRNLYPLEVRASKDDHEMDDQQFQIEDLRPKRSAALQAEKMIKHQLQ